MWFTNLGETDPEVTDDKTSRQEVKRVACQRLQGKKWKLLKKMPSETSGDFLKNKPEGKVLLQIDKKFNIKRNLSEFENIAINY